jgi:hypothetical protein
MKTEQKNTTEPQIKKRVTPGYEKLIFGREQICEREQGGGNRYDCQTVSSGLQ